MPPSHPNVVGRALTLVGLLLLAVTTAAAGWAMSYARPLDWRLLGIAHSADLTRVDPDRPTAVFMSTLHHSHHCATRVRDFVKGRRVPAVVWEVFC